VILLAKERLQKILAAAGLGSRRGCEKLIEEGRVEVNGAPAVLGSSADPLADKIRVDGMPLPSRAQTRTFALHKPRHVVSSLAAQGNRSTVRDLLPLPGRFYPVGRLDMDSEGLILLTNDGELAQRISHPKFEVEKEYSVLVAKRPAEEQLEIWRRGVVLEDGFHTAPMAVKLEASEGRGAWLRVIMHEGRKHELRDVGRTIGLPVVRIIRRRIGNLDLGDLKPGMYRELTAKETASLQAVPAQREKVRSEKVKVSAFRIAENELPRGKPRDSTDRNFQGVRSKLRGIHIPRKRDELPRGKPRDSTDRNSQGVRSKLQGMHIPRKRDELPRGKPRDSTDRNPQGVRSKLQGMHIPRKRDELPRGSKDLNPQGLRSKPRFLQKTESRKRGKLGGIHIPRKQDKNRRG
jgi:23S rRNA pseudouridine2605 synthase